MMEAKKNDAGKLRYDLIPVRPLRKVAEVYTMGCKKYAPRNWELGIEWGRIYGAMQRHANAWWSGERFDQEDGQHHLASVAWAALALMEYEDTHPELDDRQIDRPKEPRVKPWCTCLYMIANGKWYHSYYCPTQYAGKQGVDAKELCPNCLNGEYHFMDCPFYTDPYVHSVPGCQVEDSPSLKTCSCGTLTACMNSHEGIGCQGTDPE